MSSVHPQFLVRYRITNRRDGSTHWNHVRSGTKLEVQLKLDDIRNGDELQAQIRAEHPDGTILEDWSHSLLIAITKRVLIDGIPVADDDLLPPLDFQAHILSTSMVRLEWIPALQPLSNVIPFYIVNVKQLTSEDNTPLLRQQIKVQGNSFTLDSLKPGERYELTIRTASSPERISNTAAIVEITMPKEDEYFEVGNLIISSHFKGNGQGIVNLTWEVPEKILQKIKAYDVQYMEVGTGNWHQLHFSGSRPSASLTTLKSDTDYLLKIRTKLNNDLTTESGQFRFRTPAVIPNPIQKVDVIYTHEIHTVRLQWELENFLPAELVSGYDIYVSDNPDLPDTQWSFYRVLMPQMSDLPLASEINSLLLRDLQSGHIYYVRINVRKKNGEIIRAPSMYRFKTMERAEFLERREANSLSYRLLSPGRVQITWTYPSSISHAVTGQVFLDYGIGSSVFYTDNSTLPIEQWKRIILDDARQNYVVLEQLKPNSRYYIRILPQINKSFYDSSMIILDHSRLSFLPESDNVHSQMQHSPKIPPTDEVKGSKDTLIISACNPDAIKNECSWDERCVPTNEDRSRGWCISESLRDAIVNN
ncbi:unnamed protein product [Thelazia callipaeda]|uniref:Fibronectin type-III domain-containing protein n=1 Tax=Thelazia callipaeda TaxID=103827 RepID=A0A0N5CJX2_THECL|nr:unnamed protein product [Thelazia callipaeda]